MHHVEDRMWTATWPSNMPNSMPSIASTRFDARDRGRRCDPTCTRPSRRAARETVPPRHFARPTRTRSPGIQVLMNRSPHGWWRMDTGGNNLVWRGLMYQESRSRGPPTPLQKKTSWAWGMFFVQSDFLFLVEMALDQ